MTDPPAIAVPLPGPGARLAALWASDIAYSFRRTPVAVASATVLFVCLAGALLAPWVAPHNPFDLKTLNLLDALAPPAWLPGAKQRCRFR